MSLEKKQYRFFFVFAFIFKNVVTHEDEWNPSKSGDKITEIEATIGDAGPRTHTALYGLSLY